MEVKAETAARAIKIILPDGAPESDIPAGVSLEPGYTRRAIESLFGIKKTVDVQLMRRICGLGQVGSSQTVSRRHLLLFLHKVQQDPG